MWFNTGTLAKAEWYSGLCKELEYWIRPETEQSKSTATISVETQTSTNNNNNQISEIAMCSFYNINALAVKTVG